MIVFIDDSCFVCLNVTVPEKLYEGKTVVISYRKMNSSWLNLNLFCTLDFMVTDRRFPNSWGISCTYS